MSTSYIGVDLGGTTIKAGLLRDGKLVETKVADTLGDQGEEITLNVLKGLISELIDSSVKGIGVGVPSVVNRTKGIVYNVHNIKNWDEVPLKHILEEKFSVPVFIDNDANCFAMAERMFGTGRAYENFVGITLGTGVGGGIIQGGSLLKDANCGSGEYGELDYKDSIVEDYCGSRFFTMKNKTTGLDAYNKAMQGDTAALQLFADYGKHIAAMMKIIILTVDPQAIILGGAIAQSLPLFEKSMRTEMQNFLFARSAVAIKVEKSELENAGILGAASLCI